ncbi:mRNA turnover and ribosome assembly protein [Malassezia cuniculi]|uniref:Ribosome assembly factor mrt4 n=1 Tax=Malassezia cuniculi TaxID=948313 RepID=A0AAF0ETV2_9BASI|nr:mRNA turnover and ribosome assembly protein [Malassezia cuniculi]
MAKSKRAKVISLTRTKTKTREDKESHMDNVRAAAQEYEYVWVFAIANMRNSYLAEVRRLWSGSRMLFGKLRVVAKALGESPEEEVRPGIGAISQRLRGNVGLLFTNSPPAEVQDWCEDYRRLDFARMGNKATETITLPAGPVMMRTDPPETLPHPMEPHLRKLGMPTQLKNGVPTLLQDYVVCKKGEALTAERAQILKLLMIQMAHFRLVPIAYWSAADGNLTDIELDEDDKELVELAGAALPPKGSATSGARARAMDEDDDDEDDAVDPIEARDAAMMLPAGL